MLSNAVKFTDAGEVVLSAYAENSSRTQKGRPGLNSAGVPTKGGGGDMIVFEVRDTGVGIAPEHHERIFEPFWQVDGGRTRTVGGAGLGLHITRRLARLMGGEVRVASAVGRGAIFTARFPLSSAVTDAARAMQASSSGDRAGSTAASQTP